MAQLTDNDVTQLVEGLSDQQRTALRERYGVADAGLPVAVRADRDRSEDGKGSVLGWE